MPRSRSISHVHGSPVGLATFSARPSARILPERRKNATWLLIQWAASKETQIATSYGFAGAYKRTGANRTSLWQDPQYRKLMESFGEHLVDATTRHHIPAKKYQRPGSRTHRTAED